MSKEINITINQGSVFKMNVDVEAKDLVGNTMPFDLTGFSIRSMARPSHDSDEVYDFVCTIYDAPAGKFSLNMAPTVTETILCKSMVYDIEVYSDTNAEYVERIVQGRITITPQVTR